MAIDRQIVARVEFARKLSDIMAKTASAVFRKVPLDELFVEGGLTASRIVDSLGWTRFEPCNNLAPGVVRMKVLQHDHTCLTLKPGSYPWPVSLERIFRAN